MTKKKNVVVPRWMLWLLLAYFFFMGCFFMFVVDHPLVEKDVPGCMTQYEVVNACSTNESPLVRSADYTQLIPITNDSGKFWGCKLQNWTVRAC